MRLKVFSVIDDTLQLLSENQPLYTQCLTEVYQGLYTILGQHNEMVVDIRGRIKTKESLREKIIRNRFYMEYDHAQDILNHLSDLIGVSIECRFIQEEFLLLKQLRKQLTLCDEENLYYREDLPALRFDIQSKQPQIQKNGFSIYRIDGCYIFQGHRVNVELQIKSLVNTFWSEIEHKLVYKNSNYYVYDDFMKELLSSLKASLTIVDRQMSILFNQMQDTSQNNLKVTQSGFESLITKGINDIFAMKMLDSVGFTMNIKNTSTILGHYIFLNDLQNNRQGSDHIGALFHTFRKLNSIQIDFTDEIMMEEQLQSDDVFIQRVGSYLLSIINDDYDWYVFFRMLFAIEPGNNIHDFVMFLQVIKNYLVDDYWLNTSFVKLSMSEADILHHECMQMLADSLVYIGTIHILHDDKMKMINRCFVHFVEELEQRTISYRDFMQYKDAYHADWLRRVDEIFHKE